MAKADRWKDSAYIPPKPILFCPDMVEAIKVGLKTQTRRPISRKLLARHKTEAELVKAAPYQPGDVLWVRERHYCYGEWLPNGLTKSGNPAWTFSTLVPPDGGAAGRYWEEPPEATCRKYSDRVAGWYRRPSIFMLRRWSRLRLKVLEVRATHICNISRRDILAEGYGGMVDTPMQQAKAFWWFHNLWDDINKARGFGWETCCAVYAFKFYLLQIIDQGPKGTIFESPTNHHREVHGPLEVDHG